MDRIDPRVIRVSVEIDGQFTVFEDLDITAKVQKTANPLQNTCEVTITNLNRDTRNYLLTELSPFNRNRRPKRVIIETGRVSRGVTRIFYGEVTAASPTQPPDIGLTLKSQTGQHAKGKIISRSGAAKHSLKALSGGVATDLGVSLDWQATDKTVANYAFNGAALRQVDALAASGRVDVFVDDQTLVVKDRAVPIKGRTVSISQESGMIGIPEVTERGVKAKMLADVQVVVGGGLEIVSVLNPALNGLYTVYGLEYEVATRQEPFYVTADARRPVYDDHGKPIPEKPSNG